MDKRMQDVLDLLINDMRIKIYSYSIGDVIYETTRNSIVNCTNEYNNYKIYEFLALYKIKYLEESGIIEHKIAEKLYMLVLEKIRITQELSNIFIKEVYNEEMNDNEKQQKDFLVKQYTEIEMILKQYHLLMTEEEILNMFITGIKYDKYLDEDIEKIKIINM